MNMSELGLFTAAAIFALPGIATAQSPRVGLATALRQMDAGFVCPQFLPGEEARRREISAFARTLAAEGVTFTQATEIRAHFLTRHNCNASPPSSDVQARSAPETIAPVAVTATAAPQ